ncbi:heat-labile enterotoxin alpha chain domain-containing protein (plasmid) [Xanthomonas citri pv. aurantifolii]|nr:heat-labile enterotoxin alpha chain domain-containing protein [Xanthomonas citri pv. aurantifolii]TBW93141.1 heat-labile enterotoxin alpha chain domain-containing protein [Xanthomonas citri pv. aurantifolii]TBX01845.1 heat-labile enterotoxin alpha chain domain-containing protein [Xanthomonas citri pv. aurantifolii]TBX04546.1 heat-labile enterotoxin alpha chain domain-containing protein [Xanthomonas citri pv. aurantifolii]
MIFLLIISFATFPAFSAPPAIVYRAALESPDVIKQQGGFLARGMDQTRPNQPPPDTSLFNHANGAETGLSNHSSGYVSTTTSFNIAHYWVNNMLSGRGYIYHIHPTGNLIDVNASLLRYSPHPGENEYAALGTIHWSQIIGWQQVSYGVAGAFVSNRDYNRSLYSSAHAGEGAPYLAGFPPDHPAWGQAPWVDFSTCGGSAPRTLAQENCSPLDPAYSAASKYFRQHDPSVMFIATD